ncbi:MAG: valine--tRNA ligase [Chloroflexi bacterium]|nr:valine--tRNA ligase [Chloroflexota bacterium]
MSEMPKAYDFKASEQRLYEWWWRNGWFKPESATDPEAEPFTIAIPPPNVTGELHIGHAMFVSIEDLMVRFQRMRGKRALWIPGTDHASIATQLQVEKMLREEGASREAVGRDEFLRRAWQWKEKYGGLITNQLRRLGASCDWDRERFTMDPGLSRAVREAFVRLYEKGMIYRGTYLINWSPGLKTAVSDLEVEYSEEQVTLYYFKYPIAGGGFIPVATVRPETILGDTALAVHPEDERYAAYIGRKALVPILNREIPVIADEAVSREFGTGALKITPGHDPVDYEVGKRHNLPVISAMNPDATMNDAAGPYKGLDRFECRKRIWADMEAAGLTIKTEPYTTNVPRAERGGEIVEPLMSTQWFVRIQPLAEQAVRAVREGRIQIIPERFEKVYFNWLENIKDWCISRQLWWGHRVPVWYCDACGHIFTAREDPVQCEKCHSDRIRQDEDVLDTWFSSGLWPFSTLGWPDDTDDLRTYYPTDVMETGYDILFFWVARMIMSGLEFTEEPPFHTVYLHGLVRDEQGRKMSKTLNNVVNPLTVMDEYGTDALRFTLLTSSTPGNDLNLAISRVASNRNFANKIWNAARFVVGHLRSHTPENHEPFVESYDLPSRWIRSRFESVAADVTRLMEDYQFGQAGQLAYDFVWGEFCDWYVEISKLALNGDDLAAKHNTLTTLVQVLDGSLRLLHPFVPFVTEEVWGHLREAGGDLTQDWPPALMIAQWPQGSIDVADTDAESHMALVIDIVRSIRNARTDYKLDPNRKIGATIVVGDLHNELVPYAEMIARLGGLDDEKLYIEATLPEKPAKSLALVVRGAEVFLALDELVDVNKERERLEKEIKQAEADIFKTEKLLSGDFAGRAPAAVVEKERAKLVDTRDRREKLLARLKGLD